MARRRRPLDANVASDAGGRGPVTAGSHHPAAPKRQRAKPSSPPRTKRTHTYNVQGIPTRFAPAPPGTKTTRAAAARLARTHPELFRDEHPSVASSLHRLFSRQGLGDIAATARNPRREYESALRDYAKLKTAQAGAGGNRSFLRRFAGDLEEQALYAPAGLVQTEEAIRKDASDTLHGRPTIKRTGHVGKETVKGGYESLRHPGRHPGYAAVTALGVAAPVAGAGLRVEAGAGALRAGEGLGAAIRRPGYEGGSLLHRPMPKDLPIKVQGRTVGYIREPDAALPKLAARRKAKRVNRMLEHPDRAPVGTPFYESVFAPEHTVGRALRHERAIRADLAGAPATTLRQAAETLTPEEHAALRVYAVAGNRALRHPDETAGRHAATHAGWAAEGIEPKLNRTIAADTAKAAAVLRDPRAHPNFVRVTRLSRAMSRQSEREHRRRGYLSAEASSNSRATIARTYGEPGEGAPEGSFYFPMGEWFKPGGKTTAAKPTQPRPGPYGMGPPSQPLRGTNRKRTGEGAKRGVVENVPGAIAENIVTRQRRYSAEDLYRTARAIGTDTKINENQIGIRSTRRIRADHRQLVRAEQAARDSGDQTALARATQALRDFEHGRKEPLVEGEKGAKIPGVRWVDKRFLKQSETGPSDHIVMRAMRAVNRPVRDFQVYFRPGYVATNLPGNVGMGAYLHGPKVIPEMVRAKRMKGPLADLVDAAGGTTKTEAYGIGAGRTGLGKLSHVEQKVVGTISDITDRDFRRAMVRLRAAERGYKGDDGLRRLFTSDDPKVRRDAIAVSDRARKDAVDFNSLTPQEKQAAEVAYFYPWISRGGFAWTARTALNRPVTTAVLAQLAQQGKENQPGWLKNGPRWLRGQIATRAGLVNPASAWTPTTPAQTAESIMHPRGSYAAELGTPVIEAASTKPSEIGGALFGTTPVGRLLRSTGVVTDPRIVGKPGKTFQETPRSVAGGILAGGFYPKQPDKAELRKGALKDMPPERRATVKVFDRRQKFFEAAQQVAPRGLENGRLPARVRRAFNLEAERQHLYAKLAPKKPTSSSTPEERYDYYAGKLEADVRFCLKHGAMDVGRAGRIRRAIRDHVAIEALQDTSADLRRSHYESEGSFLWQINRTRHKLEKLGATGLR